MSKGWGPGVAQHVQVVSHAVDVPDIPQPPVQGVGGQVGVHADTHHRVGDGVVHISLQVIGTVLTGGIILPTN
jgi:hypothetical protein